MFYFLSIHCIQSWLDWWSYCICFSFDEVLRTTEFIFERGEIELYTIRYIGWKKNSRRLSMERPLRESSPSTRRRFVFSCSSSVERNTSRYASPTRTWTTLSSSRLSTLSSLLLMFFRLLFLIPKSSWTIMECWSFQWLSTTTVVLLMWTFLWSCRRSTCRRRSRLCWGIWFWTLLLLTICHWSWGLSL